LNNSEKWEINFNDPINNLYINDYGIVLNRDFVYVPYGDTINLGAGSWILSDIYAVKYDDENQSIVRKRVLDPLITKLN
jgi:hypothetical protein